MNSREHDLSASEAFYVGGEYVQTATGEHVMIGQMYVRRYGREKETAGKHPIIFIHGAAQTGTHWECTPDGRPGIAPLIAAQNENTVYVVDQPGIGRSRYHDGELGPLTHYGAEKLEKVFTATAFHNLWPQAKMHTQWPGTGRMGDPVFDAFYASQVGHLAGYSQVELAFRHAGAALLRRVGPAYLVTHSQSGPIGWHLADECPDLILGIVALEPRGPPFTSVQNIGNRDDYPVTTNLERPYGITTSPLTYDPPLPLLATNLPYQYSTEIPADGCVPGWHQATPPRRLPRLAGIEVVVVTGEASYHVQFDHLTVSFLRASGVDAEHIYLADHGICGNGHLMAVELNNVEISRFILKWIESKEKDVKI
jgi:pimeloyl-ACP methyl ester carboxylesterase